VRVGLICPYSLSLPGGVQNQVLGLARALRLRGVDTRVLAPCDGAPPDPAVTPLGMSLPTAANGSIAPIAPDPACQLRVIRALRDEAFDVLHLHEPLAPGPTMTATMLRAAPLLGTFHAAGESAAYRWLGPGVRWLAERLDHRCAVSADAERLARNALGGVYERVFNGVELDRFEAVKPHPTTGPTVFFCTRHEERKGLAVLLAALRHLPEQVTVWVGGEGPETTALRARWGDDPRVQWLGRIEEDEKIERMVGADVFCAPSLRGESFGVVLLEAMAAGTVVVASDIPGYANVARAEVEALLVPPGDPAALAGALRRALGDDASAGELVVNGLTRAAEHSMDRLAGRYLGMYERLAGHHGARAGRARWHVRTAMRPLGRGAIE
jgi:phosphatidylinositol alpha-mannosyltransferase